IGLRQLFLASESPRSPCLFVQILGKRFGESICQRLRHDGVVIVMLPLELFGEFVCTMNRNSKSAKIVRQRQCMIAVSRRHEIRQAMVELSCRLLYLLAQEIEGVELLRAIIVGIKIQVVAN